MFLEAAKIENCVSAVLRRVCELLAPTCHFVVSLFTVTVYLISLAPRINVAFDYEFEITLCT